MSADSKGVKIIAESTAKFKVSTAWETYDIQEFEKEITQYIEAGAGDRTTALKWILDSITEVNEDDEDDPDEYYDRHDVYFGDPIVEKEIEIDVYDVIEKHHELPKGYLKATEE